MLLSFLELNSFGKNIEDKKGSFVRWLAPNCNIHFVWTVGFQTKVRVILLVNNVFSLKRRWKEVAFWPFLTRIFTDLTALLFLLIVKVLSLQPRWAEFQMSFENARTQFGFHSTYISQYFFWSRICLCALRPALKLLPCFPPSKQKYIKAHSVEFKIMQI